MRAIGKRDSNTLRFGTSRFSVCLALVFERRLPVCKLAPRRPKKRDGTNFEEPKRSKFFAPTKMRSAAIRPYGKRRNKSGRKISPFWRSGFESRLPTLTVLQFGHKTVVLTRKRRYTIKYGQKIIKSAREAIRHRTANDRERESESSGRQHGLRAGARQDHRRTRRAQEPVSLPRADLLGVRVR